MTDESTVPPGSAGRLLALIDGSRGSGQNAALDGLRGLSVALVFFVHLPLWLAPWLASGTIENTAVRIMGVGQTGVDIFFALSGFLIYGNLIAKPQPYGAFLRRRLQRLYPLYLVTIFVVMFIRTAGTGSLDWLSASGNPLVLLVTNLAMVPTWAVQPPIYGVTWTLTWEWQFYLVMPLVVMVFKMRDRARFTRIALLIGLWGLQGIAASLGDRGIIRYAAFGAGSLAAEWAAARRERRDAGLPVKSLRGAGILASAAVAGIVVFGSLAGVPTRVVVDDQIKIDLSWATRGGQEVLFRWAFLFVIPVVVVAAIDGVGGISRVLSNRWLRRLGVVSYSFYLCHYMVTRISLELLAKVMVPGETSNLAAMVVGSILAATLTVGATMVAFAVVERPLSLDHDPFLTVVPPRLVRRPTLRDILPDWTRVDAPTSRPSAVEGRA